MILDRWSTWTVLIITSMVTGCAPLITPRPPAAPAEFLKATTAGDATIVAVAPPAHSFPTLPEFLGIPQCYAATQICCVRTLACFGFLFPGLGADLQPGPPLLPITDPANLLSTAPPSVQAAAQVKAKEDEAAQKIQALRYLATIGCGCYQKEIDIEGALIASLEDCTEEVRFEAAKAIRETAGCYCHVCNQNGCCSEKIQKKLHELAFESDDNGCQKEPSERVRRQARLALAQCGPAPPAPAKEPAPAEPVTPPEGPAETGEGAEGPEEGDEESPPPPADSTESDPVATTKPPAKPNDKGAITPAPHRAADSDVALPEIQLRSAAGQRPLIRPTYVR